MNRFLRVVFLSAVLSALGPTAVVAQVTQAELRGTIVDESGAALPGTTITATHVSTGTVRTTTSSETGSYVMPALPVGEYRVAFELQGFSTLVHERLVLSVGQSAIVNPSMKVASLEETIVVTGESPLIETKRSEIAGRVEPEQVQNLPLNGRSWLDLVALVPGARGNPGTVRAGASGGDMAKYQVDGVDVSGQCCGGTNQNYSQENIQEFQVLTNRFDAEYGRVGGVVINAVTKSGTNSFRATTFGFVRDDRFDAPNFFTGQVAPFHEVQMGANGGGPIVRNRVHFFMSYERQNRDITVRPNTSFAQFDVDASQDVKRRYYTARIDGTLGGGHRVFGRTSRDVSEQENVSVGGRTALSGGYFRPARNNDLSLGDTWVMTDRVVHEVRVGFSRIDNSLEPNSTMPRHSFPSVIIGPPTNAPQWWKEFNIQANNALTIFVPSWHGEHHVKAGFQFFRPKFYGWLPQALHGSYTFPTDPADINNPATYPQASTYATSLGDFSYSVTNPIYAAYVQDNWTLTRKLTFNVGVRYDVETGVKNTDVPNPFEAGERKTDIDNVSPRLGFAYDLRGDGRTVIRGGAGRYYDKVLLNITSNERRLAAGQFIGVTITNPVYGNPLGGLTFTDFKARNIPTNYVVIGNDYQTPRQDQVSIGVAQQFGTRFAVQADFVHSKGVNEPRAREINQFKDPNSNLPLSTRVAGRPHPQYARITRYETSAKSKYDGLQVGFDARDSGPQWLRVQFKGSYTLSWTKDDHEGNRFASVTNPFNLADEYSWAGSDQRHRFTVNGLTALPWDIHFSVIFFAGSKRTIDIASNLDPFNIGVTGRWMDAAGRTLTRNGERTAKNDYKLDLRLSKRVKAGPVRLEGVVDAFNVLNTKNFTSYGTQFGSRTYLQPASSTNLFYQPRQVQLGFRISY